MIRINPARSQFDTVVQICVNGLRANQNITLFSLLQQDDNCFGAYAFYTADTGGLVDCQRHQSVGGSFKGCHPMGLFSLMVPVCGTRHGSMYTPPNVTDPVLYKFAYLNGHANNPWDDNMVKFQTIQCERFLMNDEVERILITDGRVRGAVFKPKEHDGPLPAIIDLYGTRGGLIEHRAALLASHGFCVLALAYFNYKDLTPDMSDIHMEYFQEAVNWLDSRPFVVHNNLGVIGLSMGGDVAHNIASLSDKIKAVVSINSCHFNEPFARFYYKDQLLPSPPINLDLKTIGYNDGDKLHYIVLKNMDVEDKYCFPIDRSDAKFLIICSTDDHTNNSVKSGRILTEKLRKAGKSKNVELVECEGAGHILEPPYFPFVYESYHRIYKMLLVWGGKPEMHMQHAAEVWQRIINFFKSNISENGKSIKATIDYNNSKL